jgi:hypothetical protein
MRLDENPDVTRRDAARSGVQDRGVDRAISDELARTHCAIEQDVNAIAHFQIGVEIQLASENFGELERQLDVLFLGVERVDNGPVVARDDGRHGRRHVLFRHGDDRRVERGRPCARRVLKHDAKEIIRVDVIPEFAEQTVNRARDSIRPIGAQIARVKNCPSGGDDGRGKVGGQLRLHQQTLEGRVGRHQRFGGLVRARARRKDDVAAGAGRRGMNEPRLSGRRKATDEDDLPDSRCRPRHGA